MFVYDPACDLFDLAAAYVYHIAKAHAFSDGNKRTAYATALTFLAFNGVWLFQPHNTLALAEATVASADGRLTKSELAALMRQLPAERTPWGEWQLMSPEEAAEYESRHPIERVARTDPGE